MASLAEVSSVNLRDLYEIPDRNFFLLADEVVEMTARYRAEIARA